MGALSSPSPSRAIEGGEEIMSETTTSKKPFFVDVTTRDPGGITSSLRGRINDKAFFGEATGTVIMHGATYHRIGGSFRLIVEFSVRREGWNAMQHDGEWKPVKIYEYADFGASFAGNIKRLDKRPK